MLCFKMPFSSVFGRHLGFSDIKNYRRELSRNYLCARMDEILLQISYFPALYNFCPGSPLILPAYTLAPRSLHTRLVVIEIRLYGNDR